MIRTGDFDDMYVRFIIAGSKGLAPKLNVHVHNLFTPLLATLLL